MNIEAEIFVDINYPSWENTFPMVGQFVKVVIFEALMLSDIKGEVELGVMLTSDEVLKKYNLKYRGVNSATNVLSFQQEFSDMIRGKNPQPLGDLMLGYQIIMKESYEQNKLLSHHLAHLVVHGFLHLIGYDHTDTKDATLMEKKETEILGILGFSDPYKLDNNLNY
tara:strand:- start:2404 stop:2904 length:501 start_codon:yes stop_codon:yes gene_type:complete